MASTRKPPPDKITITDADFHDLRVEAEARGAEFYMPSYPYIVVLGPRDMRKLARWLNAQAGRMEKVAK